MRWSQLKKRFEDTFADALRGRLEVWATTYRPHDGICEAWVTFDKQRVLTTGYQTFGMAHYKAVQPLLKERHCSDYRDAAQRAAYYATRDEVTNSLIEAGIFDSFDMTDCMFNYLNLGIGDALNADNPITRAFVLLDRRFGKRRLKDFDATGEHMLVRQFHGIRCRVEGLPLDRTVDASAVLVT